MSSLLSPSSLLSRASLLVLLSHLHLRLGRGERGIVGEGRGHGLVRGHRHGHRDHAEEQDQAGRPKRRYSTGTTSMLRAVDESSPPRMTTPMGA